MKNKFDIGLYKAFVSHKVMYPQKKKEFPEFVIVGIQENIKMNPQHLKT